MTEECLELLGVLLMKVALFLHSFFFQVLVVYSFSIYAFSFF